MLNHYYHYENHSFAQWAFYKSWIICLSILIEGCEKIKLKEFYLDSQIRRDIKQLRDYFCHGEIYQFFKYSQNLKNHNQAIGCFFRNLGNYLYTAMENNVASGVHLNESQPTANLPLKNEIFGNISKEALIEDIGDMYILWNYANIFKDHFYKKNDTEMEKLFFMDFWYACLYILIEKYKKKSLKRNSQYQKDIEDLLKDLQKIGVLKHYRNATLHYHNSYYNFPLKKPLFDETNFVLWINNIHKFLGLFLIELHNSIRYERGL